MTRPSEKDEHLSILDRVVNAARDLQSEPDPRTTMQFAVDVALVNIDGCDAAAISLVSQGGSSFTTPVHTGELALTGDLLQYEMRQGPCLEAIWHEPVVHSSDLTSEPRWPVWARCVSDDHGARSMLCFRLFTNGRTLGALNLYSRRVGAFDAAARDEGLALAAQIALAMSAAQHAEQMHIALDSRTAIAQATGVVMERYGITSSAAFAVLSRLSSQTNTKLREIAATLVRTGHLRVDEGQAPACSPRADEGASTSAQLLGARPRDPRREPSGHEAQHVPAREQQD